MCIINGLVRKMDIAHPIDTSARNVEKEKPMVDSNINAWESDAKGTEVIGGELRDGAIDQHTIQDGYVDNQDDSLRSMESCVRSTNLNETGSEVSPEKAKEAVEAVKVQIPDTKVLNEVLGCKENVAMESSEKFHNLTDTVPSSNGTEEMEENRIDQPATADIKSEIGDEYFDSELDEPLSNGIADPKDVDSKSKSKVVYLIVSTEFRIHRHAIDCHYCVTCEYETQKKCHLRRHLVKHDLYLCFHCNRGYIGVPAFERHVRTDHPGRDAKFCLLCLKHFSDREFVSHAQECREDQRSLICVDCDKVFKSRKYLNAHMKTHHSAEGSLRVFACNQCQFSSKYKHVLKKHLQYVHDKDKTRDFECDQCQSKFFHKEGLKKHMKIHSAELAFACPRCPKMFRHNDQLVAHKKCHQNEIFACDFPGCKKVFNHQIKLTKHKRQAHNPSYRFRCEECDVGFVKRSGLDKHMALHPVGDRSFICDWPACGQVFRYEYNLKVHYLTHSNERAVNCRLCGFMCQQKNSLDFHMSHSHPGHTTMILPMLSKGQADQRMSIYDFDDTAPEPVTTLKLKEKTPRKRNSWESGDSGGKKHCSSDDIDSNIESPLSELDLPADSSDYPNYDSVVQAVLDEMRPAKDGNECEDKGDIYNSSTVNTQANEKNSYFSTTNASAECYNSNGSNFSRFSLYTSAATSGHQTPVMSSPAYNQHYPAVTSAVSCMPPPLTSPSLRSPNIQSSEMYPHHPSTAVPTGSPYSHTRTLHSGNLQNSYPVNVSNCMKSQDGYNRHAAAAPSSGHTRQLERDPYAGHGPQSVPTVQVAHDPYASGGQRSGRDSYVQQDPYADHGPRSVQSAQMAQDPYAQPGPRSVQPHHMSHDMYANHRPRSVQAEHYHVQRSPLGHEAIQKRHFSDSASYVSPSPGSSQSSRTGTSYATDVNLYPNSACSNNSESVASTKAMPESYKSPVDHHSNNSDSQHSHDTYMQPASQQSVDLQTPLSVAPPSVPPPSGSLNDEGEMATAGGGSASQSCDESHKDCPDAAASASKAIAEPALGTARVVAQPKVETSQGSGKVSTESPSLHATSPTEKKVESSSFLHLNEKATEQLPPYSSVVCSNPNPFLPALPGRTSFYNQYTVTSSSSSVASTLGSEKSTTSVTSSSANLVNARPAYQQGERPYHFLPAGSEFFSRGYPPSELLPPALPSQQWPPQSSLPGYPPNSENAAAIPPLHMAEAYMNMARHFPSAASSPLNDRQAASYRPTQASLSDYRGMAQPTAPAFSRFGMPSSLGLDKYYPLPRDPYRAQSIVPPYIAAPPYSERLGASPLYPPSYGLMPDKHYLNSQKVNYASPSAANSESYHRSVIYSMMNRYFE